MNKIKIELLKDIIWVYVGIISVLSLITLFPQYSHPYFEMLKMSLILVPWALPIMLFAGIFLIIIPILTAILGFIGIIVVTKKIIKQVV